MNLFQWAASVADQARRDRDERVATNPEYTSGLEAGWYDDPECEGFVRWWSGEAWTGGPVDPLHVN